MWRKIYLRYKYSVILLRELVRTDFKIKYQDSILGYIWSVLKPLFVFIILYVVFVLVLRVGANIQHWPVALLTGIVLWQFFTDVTSGALKSIVSNGNLLRKIKFPRYIIVVSNTISAFITLLINSLVVVLFGIFTGVTLSWEALLLIPLVAELFVFALGVAFFLSAVYVRFRDIQYIWEVVSQGLFYGSAIIFPVSLVANIGGVGWAIAALANPVAQIIQDVRVAVINPNIPSLWSLSGENWLYYLIPLAAVAGTFVLGVWYFKKRSPYFAEDV